MKTINLRILPKLFSICFFPLVLGSGASLFAQVGINTTAPKSTLDINGALSLREGTAISLSNGTNNNVSLGASIYSNYRITGPTADFSISGFIPANGADGQLVIIQNTTSQDMTIIHDSGSIAANRIYIPGEKDYILRGLYTSITFQYSASLSRWVMLDKMNHLETWYLGPTTIAAGNNTFTAIIPSATIGSSASVNMVGTLSSPVSSNLFFEYIETQAGQVVFRVLNEGGIVNNVTFAITINKI